MTGFIFLFLTFVIFLVVLISVLIYLKKSIEKTIEKKKEDVPLTLLKQDLESIRKGVEDGYSQLFQEIGKMKEIGHMMKDFQDFFRAPKSRGNIGEQILRDLLEQILPKNNFKLQYKFNEGQIVDAIIKTKQGIIPVDSKFPMESFRRLSNSKTEERERKIHEFTRDIKKHIDSISKKYILPQEGTVDFALMYIPSEAVYYEITSNQPELVDYASKKKVYFVSPNSFYYFLKTIMMGLEGARIEEASRRILDGLRGLKQESLKFNDELEILISHINRAKNASERVSTRFMRLESKIDNLGILKEKEDIKEIENGGEDGEEENKETEEKENKLKL